MNYHIGNYYGWTAAVAMNDSSAYEEDDETLVSQSICPAGWTLPLSGSNTGSGSFYNLVSQYGWNSSEETMAGSYTIWGEPLNFVLSGAWTGSLMGIGTFGSY